MSKLFDFVKASAVVVTSAIGILFTLLADILDDIDDAENLCQGSDLTGTSGVSEAGLSEPVVFDSDGNAIGSISGTNIIG